MKSISSSVVERLVDCTFRFLLGARFTPVVRKRAGAKYIGVLDELEQRTLLSSVYGVIFEDHDRDGIKGTEEPGLANRAVSLTAADFTNLLDADFSDGAGGTSLDGFTADDLWHETTACDDGDLTHSAAETAYFGIDASCNFDAGMNSGSLTSSAISLPTDSETQLTFSYRLDGESGPIQDVASVQISVDGGDFLTLVTDADGSLPESIAWRGESIDLSAYAGHDIAIRFHFDTYDEWSNAGLGWQVDDVRVESRVVTRLVSDESGSYSFTGLNEGMYSLQSEVPPGWTAVGPNPLPLLVNASDLEISGFDFASFRLGTISGQVYADSDLNGIKSPDDPGLNGWRIQLVDSNGLSVAWTQTSDLDLDGNGVISSESESGLFDFTDLPTETYSVVPETRNGWITAPLGTLPPVH